MASLLEKFHRETIQITETDARGNKLSVPVWRYENKALYLKDGLWCVMSLPEGLYFGIDQGLLFNDIDKAAEAVIKLHEIAPEINPNSNPSPEQIKEINALIQQYASKDYVAISDTRIKEIFGGNLNEIREKITKVMEQFRDRGKLDTTPFGEEVPEALLQEITNEIAKTIGADPKSIKIKVMDHNAPPDVVRDLMESLGGTAVDISTPKKPDGNPKKTVH